MILKCYKTSVLAATNEAMNKADELTQERLGKHTQGLNILECDHRCIIQNLYQNLLIAL